MYLHATLEVSYEGAMDFMAVAPKVRALMEANGVKMLYALMQDTGRLNTFVHIWKLRDANHYYEAVNALKAHESFPEIFAGLGKSVVNETLVFASDAPYAPR
ncbi:MAG: NIPSNAP family protein [Caulobacterales bacterium]